MLSGYPGNIIDMFPREEGFKLVARHQCYPLESPGNCRSTSQELEGFEGFAKL